MASAFAAATAIAGIVLAAFGADERGTDLALQATARFSFLLFWLAYAGPGLAALLPAAQPLRRHGREFGLAFAAAHLVHVGLVIRLCAIGAAPAAGVFLFFGPPLACIYVLALCSIRRLHQALGPAGWRLLRIVAMNWIAYAFAADFLRYPLHGGARHVAEYMPFAALSLVGPLLYLVSLLPSLGRLKASA